jgi:Predicted HKD family nuclease
MRADVDLIFLPYDDRSQKTLADVLVKELREGDWTEFRAAVAFARQTGNFEELQAALQKFCDNGGTIRLTFGANIFEHTEGSDYDAIATLLKALENYPNAQIYLFQDPNRTFHPKVYVFNNVGAALLIIGSSNWSDGGFINNVEVNPVIRLNLDNKPEADLFARVIEIFEKYWTEADAKQEGQGWARRVTTANLQEFKDSLHQVPEGPTTPKTVKERSADSEKHFEGIHFKTPKRFTAPSRAVRKSQEKEKLPAATAPKAGAISQEETGFWKVLSDFDVSKQGAPGQIIIPMRFRDLFPDQRLVKQPDAGGKGRQWDTEFALTFRDGNFTATADARFIVYEPESGHPRPNTECRFTFRNRAIFDRLNAGDILSFHFVPGRSLLVERFAPASDEYRVLRRTDERWGTI